MIVIKLIFTAPYSAARVECSDQKTYLAKVAWNAQKLRGRHLSRPHRLFWGSLAALLNFAGGAALQAVSERPLRR